MAEPSKPRTRAERIRDTRERLAHDRDAWVATAGADGPWMVPLSFHWEDPTLIMATEEGRTVSNLRRQPRVRLGLGGTRDVVMVHGEAELVPIDEFPAERIDAMRFDPRAWATIIVIVRPWRIQAWREANELHGRTIMRDGRWLS